MRLLPPPLPGCPPAAPPAVLPPLLPVEVSEAPLFGELGDFSSAGAAPCNPVGQNARERKTHDKRCERNACSNETAGKQTRRLYQREQMAGANAAQQQKSRRTETRREPLTPLQKRGSDSEYESEQTSDKSRKPQSIAAEQRGQ